MTTLHRTGSDTPSLLRAPDKPHRAGSIRRRRRSGFSLFETLAVLTIVSVATAVIVGAYSAKGRPGSDEGARSALTSLVDVQTTEMMTNRTPAPVSALSGRLPGVTVTTGASDDDSTVSVAVDGNIVGAAASTGSGSCWLVRRDFDGNQSPIVWSVASTGSCTGERALTTSLAGSRGETSDQPVLID